MNCILIVLLAIIVAVMGALDPDNPSHREISDKLDQALGDNPVYKRVARPVIHGTYHMCRYANSGNPEEYARAIDQFSKFGTGQEQTEYYLQLKGQREQQEQQEQERQRQKQQRQLHLLVQK